MGNGGGIGRGRCAGERKCGLFWGRCLGGFFGGLTLLGREEKEGRWLDEEFAGYVLVGY